MDTMLESLAKRIACTFMGALRAGDLVEEARCSLHTVVAHAGVDRHERISSIWLDNGSVYVLESHLESHSKTLVRAQP